MTPLAVVASNNEKEQTVEAIPELCKPLTVHPVLGPSVLGAKDSERGEGCKQAPASSLVSPPESSHEDTGNSPATIEATYISSPSRSGYTSPRPQEHFQRCTPESGSMRRTSQSSCGDGLIEKEQQKSQRQVSASAQIADKESLKLIKELQAQDLGLRRRGKG